MCQEWSHNHQVAGKEWVLFVSSIRIEKLNIIFRYIGRVVHLELGTGTPFGREH